ncbi:MAG: type ISP restriction/modification enzyme [Sulfuritalea sp.]|nr:type ISP restriction/modification enzyme [Sulfuritalea sp.]
MRWPARTDGVEAQQAWREQWAGAFKLQYRQAINDAKSLALALAHLAKRIRVRANDVLKAESARGHLHKLHQAFKDNLIADLTPDGFADMFAQTIAYGLFTAHVSRGSGALVADDVALMVPSTNPFLRDLLQDFLQAAGRARQRHQRVDFDELGINDVVDLLRHAPMYDILRSFNSERPGEDPVIHFYEDFLKAYDKKMRAKRGVFYTPRPVVQFIVNSVHEILQTEFGIEDGLASTITWGEMRKRKPELALPAHTTNDSPFVQILDPATGTATFLVEVIDLIHRHMLAKWRGTRLDNEEIAVQWNAYVRAHLLPRLHGFELMMAPYAIAHMKIGLKLAETGYRFPEDGPRVNVFLTNTLEPAHEIQPQLEVMAPMLAHEARAANLTKERLSTTIIIGNPPYAGHSVNNNVPSIVNAVHEYKRGYPDLQKPGQGKWLQNDYVKFIRFSELRLVGTGIGILGFITDHSYLDNPTFKGMRRHLRASFPWLRIADLHGNSKKKERTADGGKDESIFGIIQGTAVGLFARGPGIVPSEMDFNLFGAASMKFETLLSRLLAQQPLQSLNPTEPFWLFKRQEQAGRDDYETGWPLPQIFDRNGDPAPGLVTTHDEFAISWDAREARRKVEALLATSSEAEARELFQLCTQDQWSYDRAKQELTDGKWKQKIEPIIYRPFDTRVTVYDSNVAVHRRERVMNHMLMDGSIGFATCRQLANLPWSHVLALRGIQDDSFVSNRTKERGYCLPLWLYGARSDKPNGQGRSANLNPAFVAALSKGVGLGESDWQPEKATAPINAEKVFHYIYAVLHSAQYREHYAGFLRIDFPRIPVPGSRALFDALSTQGEQLVQWHLLEHPTAVAITATTAPKGVNVPVFFGSDRRLIKVAEKSRELADLQATAAGPSGKVCINATSGFSGVAQTAWRHTIGCYQVLHKWLDDRRKAERSLSDDDIAHWRRIYAALEVTQALIGKVDQAIAANGGWPSAFSQDHPPPDPATLAAQPAAKKPRAKRASAGQTSLFGDADEAEEGKPRPKARATPARTTRSAGGAAKAELDDAASMAALREVLRLADEPLARKALIQRAAHALGYQRTGPKIAVALDDAVRRAVRRGIAVSERGTFHLLTRNIGDYERDFLKTQLLACLGRDWVERKDLARRLARWLGFARTGATIEATVKSLVTSLLRNGVLQRRGTEVHRA